MEILIEILKDTTLDSLKLLPFLFVSYLIIELIEHKSSDKMKRYLIKSGKFGSILGALFGVVPQCGFSVTAATLFSSGVITVGTLISVFISTSDEAILVLLSSPQSISKIFPLILVKVCFAILVGIIIDLFVLKNKNKKEVLGDYDKHTHDVCSSCKCDENIFISVLKHTFSIFIFIFIFSLVINIIIALIGEENLSKLLLSGSMFQPIVAGLIGLIPNCAASVLLTELYIQGVVSFASVIAGLSVGSGVGLIVLFRQNKDMKQNLKIMLTTFSASVIFGILIEIIEVIL